MNVLLFCCCVFTAAVVTGHVEPDDFIGFSSAPDAVARGSEVHVRYRCSGPCRLVVEAVVAVEAEAEAVVFRREWTGGGPGGVFRVRRVPLRWPPSVLYRRDFFNRRVLDARRVTVRARLHRLDAGGEEEEEAGLSVSTELRVQPPAERPAPPAAGCPSWSARLLWRTSGTRTQRCPHESAVVDMLTFPLASSGRHFGAVRRFHPFADRTLEGRRAVTQPSVSFSVWVFLLRRCRQKLCGVVHHVSRTGAYDSVLMQLTDTGDIIVQVRVASGEDEAFQAEAAMPNRKWIRLDCYIQNTEVCLDTTWDDITVRHRYKFLQSVHYDDADGYFVIGGSRDMPSISGYFGPFKYYRLGTEEVENQLDPTMQILDQTHRECQEVKALTRAFLKEVTESHDTTTGASSPRLTRLWRPSRENVCMQTWSWEEHLKHRTLFRFLQTEQENIRAGPLSLRELRRVLFHRAVGSMFAADREPNETADRSTALLRMSSCIGDHEASLLLAALCFSGLERPVDQQQGHVYSLIGAAGNNRFALMHAGYKHQHGLDGFPKDPGVAYSYYSNAGVQSSADNVHGDQQHLLELVYLSSPEDLRLTQESGDGVHFLQYRAARGDAESQRQLGTVLLYGRHGVQRDAPRAAEWLHRSAMRRDPAAMYDYSVMLMKGHGVKKNFTRGLKLMEKAAEMGSVSALNGLGWYFGFVLSDHEKALSFFRQAALNGSADAEFNLGVYELTGQNPAAPRSNETAAFLRFLNASRLGHDAAAVEAARYLSTGRLEGVAQDAEAAVMMLKQVCDRSGRLGFLVRVALQEFLQGSRRLAFVKYALAAEAGLDLAQSNAAYLCEELQLGPDCQWRYHNFSTLTSDPRPDALLKVGDLYASRGSAAALGEAVRMYGRAAAAGSPEGMYNLAVLAERGFVLPASVLGSFNASLEPDVLLNILRRCVRAEGEEALVTPCSLTLVRVRLGRALRGRSQSGAELLLTFASLLSVAVALVVVPLQSRLERREAGRRASAPRAWPAREQDGGGGGASGTAAAAGNLSGERRLLQSCDAAVTLAGVCMCVCCTALLLHVLGPEHA
ncbi:protein sel-1 homolog 3 [Clinocottus analis]|uniref:protein sel-1 homolog 3 n=1 Tax=Clinocottus analis TaxID=304258 RepID=UPI0035C18BD8